MQGLILFGLILFGIYLLNEQGLISVLVRGDASYLSWLILALWLAISARWLYLLYWVQKHDGSRGILAAYPRATSEAVFARWLNHGWFAADAALKLGLLGTIIGFISMLSPIASLTSFDTASLQSALGEMSGGMAIALYTTLTGLVANILIRFQFQLLGDAMQKLLLTIEIQNTK